jgi:hypothetical protein
MSLCPDAGITSLIHCHSIPISPDRPIEVSTPYFRNGYATHTAQNNYLDAYLRVIKNTDPVRSALVFSCGMGAVRTTFAMVAAVIVRRKMLLARGLEDPYASRLSLLSNIGSGAQKIGSGNFGVSTASQRLSSQKICL